MNDRKRCQWYPQIGGGGRCRLDKGHDGPHVPSEALGVVSEAAESYAGKLRTQSSSTQGAAAAAADLFTSPAAMAERLRLAGISRARRIIVLEIDSLRADNEGTRADALQGALDAIDHVFRTMALHGEGWR